MANTPTMASRRPMRRAGLAMRAHALLAAVGALCAGGCLHRGDFVPPTPPLPLEPAHAPTPAVEPPSPLTAVAAVRLALERNPDLSAAAARVAQARTQLATSVAPFLPRVVAEASYLYGNAPSAYLFKRIDGRVLPPAVDFNDPGRFVNLEGGLGLSWNLWNGGRDLLAYWARDTAVQAAALAHDAAANALVAAVVATYLDAQAARELLAADDASVRAVEAQVAEGKVRVAGGGALRSDLLSLEVRLAEAREQRFRTETAHRVALAMLRMLLALPPEAPLELADEPLELAALPSSVGEALAEAYRSRPEAALARRSVERARLELASARRAYLPRIDVATRLYADVPEALHIDPKDPNWTVAIALSVDLFDGGARGAAIRSARAALDELSEADRAMLLAIAREIETAWLRLEEARARLAVASQAVAAAEETLQLVDVQYRGGAATVTRYLETETAAARARTTRIQARLDVDRAMVELHRAMGRLPSAVGMAMAKDGP